MAETAATFNCPSCGKKIKWKPDIAGKPGKCPCGSRFTAPSRADGAARVTTAPATAASDGSVRGTAPASRIAAGATAPARAPTRAAPRSAAPPQSQLQPDPDPAPDIDDLYDLADGDPAPAPARPPILVGAGGVCPSCDAPLAKGAVLCVACGHDLRTGAKVGEVPASAPKIPATVANPAGALPPRTDSGALLDAEEESWLTTNKGWELIVVSILVPLGVFLSFVEAMYYGQAPGDAPIPFASALPTVGLGIAANIGLMIAAVFVAAMLVEDAFVTDPWWKIILKIAAIGLVPGPIGTIVDQSVGDINGNIAGVFTAVGLYAGLFFLLFRWNALNTAACVLVIWVIRTGVMYAMFKLEGIRTNSWI